MASLFMLLAAVAAQGAWQLTGAPGAATVRLSDRPGEMAIAAGARLLVVGTEDRERIVLVDPDSGAVAATLAAEGKPLALAVDAPGARVFAIEDSRNFVYVYDVATRAVAARWRMSGDLVALALRPDGSELLVADQSGKRILALNPANGAILRQKALGVRPQHLSVNAANTRILVGAENGRLVTLDAATFGVVSQVALGDDARSLSFWDRTGLAVVVQSRIDALSLVNVENGTLVGRVEISTGPQRGTVDDAASKAYVSTKDDSAVSQVDLASRTADGRFVLPSQAAAVLFDASARMLYVSLPKDKSVLRIDPSQHPLLGEVVLQKRLRDIAVNNATHEAATLAERSNELSRIRLADRAVDTLALDGKPERIAIDTGRNLAIVAVKSRIRFVDLSASPPVLLPAEVDLGSQVNALAVDSARGVTVVATQGADEHSSSGKLRLHLVDDATFTKIASLASPDKLLAVAVDSRRGLAYLVADGRKLVAFDIGARAFTRSTALPFQPDAIAVDAALNLAVLIDDDHDKAHVVNLETNVIARSYAVARGPAAVDIQPATHAAVVASREADQISVIDLVSGSLAAGYAQVESPFALATSSRFNVALVLSGERDEIIVVPLANPAPQLSSITPSQAIAGSPSFTLSARGAGFVDPSRILFGSTELATRWIDATSLEATVPSTLVAAPGQAAVRVRSPGPAGGESTASTFTIFPALAISSMSPASGPAGTQVTLGGVSFDPVASNNLVSFPGAGSSIAALVQSASETQLVVVVPAGAQTGPITVTNARGTALSPVFTVIPPLAITAISPDSGLPGAVVTITGTSFDPVAANDHVTFTGPDPAGVPAAVQSATSTQLVVVVPADARTGPIAVSAPFGSATSASFTVIPPPPVIDSVSPASGSALSVVTIAGSHFDANAGNDNVTFGGVAGPVLVASETSLLVRVPAGAATGAISVTTPNGTAVGPVFTVLPPLENDVQLLASPATMTIYQGAAGSSQIQLPSTGTNAFSGVAALAASGLPPGVSATFLPAPSISSYQPNTLTLSASADATPGDYTVTVTAQADTLAGPLARTGTIAVKVLSSAGVTGLKGRFVTPGHEGIAGVIVRADNGAVTQPQTTTDAAGNFQLVGLEPGDYTLRFDATPANPLYPIWPYSITVVANRIQVIPDWTINPPPADEKFTPIANATQDQSVTDPRFPGLEIRLPAGTTIIGWDGVKKSRIAVEQVNIAKLPVTPPPVTTGAGYQLYFGTPMGGIPSQPIPVTLPNDVEAEPGDSVDVWYFDGSPMGGSGTWKVAGQGIVSDDGKTVAMPNGTGIPRFCGVCGLMCLGKIPPAPQPPPGPPPPCDGNPVDLSNGQEMPRSRGMSCGGLTPIEAGMSYNPVDAFNGVGGTSGSIGFGWVLDYDIAFLPFAGPQKRLILPGNNRVNFTDDGTGTYRVVDDPRFDGATIRATNLAANEWELKFKDGRAWRFKPYPGVPVFIKNGPPTFVHEIVDAQGNVLAINRQSEGKIVSIGTADRNIAFTYGPNGFASQMADTAGRVTRLAYNGQNRLSSVTDPDGRITSYTYVDDTEFVPPAVCGTLDSLGERLKTITYPGRPNPTTNDYGPGRRVLRQVGYDGREFRFSYRVTGACVTNVSNPNVLCTGVTCPDVDSWENFQAGWRIYGGKVVSTTVTQPDGTSYTHSFDSRGASTASTDTFGQQSTTRFDASHRVVEKIDPLGRSYKYAYDANGNIAQSIDPLGRITNITYDATWNKPTSVTRYDDSGQPFTTSFVYDAGKGMLLSITNPANETTYFTYTNRGELQTVTDALGKVTRFEYNLTGDLTKITDALLHEIRFGYDGVGRRTTTVDPLTFTTSTAYNGVDAITRITDARSKSTDLSYDAAGRLQSVTNARGYAIETYGYDSGDRLSLKTDAFNNSARYQYDSSGRLASTTDRKAQVTGYEYDGESRVAVINRPEGTARFSYDIVGRLVQVSDPAGTISYSYDAADRLVKETQSAGGVTTTIEFGYDNLDRRVSRTVSGVVNETTTYGYDRAGRLTSIGYRGQTTSFEYDAVGRLTKRTLPNGVVETFAYDDAGHLLEILYANPDGAAIDTIDYAYDDDGRRISEIRSQGRAPEIPFTATYDAGDRMTSITLVDTGATFDLAYDDNGNLVRKVERGNAANVTTYTWDSMDRLTSIDGPGLVALFQYDSLGRRVSRTVNGETTRYIYDGLQAIAELRSSGPSTLLTTLAIDEVIARYVAGNARVYLTDDLNSVLAQTAADRTVLNSYRYSAYGLSASSGPDEGNDVQYAGRENDSTGLYYYRARYYDPVLKRFIEEDPSGSGTGLTTYGYVAGNPLAYVDPTGELPFIPILIGLALGVGSQSTSFQNAASNAAQYWADRQQQTGNWAYAIPGALAALADPCTAWKTAAVLGAGAAAGGYMGRPFWQYYPAGNPGYSSPWLTRGWGWRPPYQTGQQAVERLSLPPYNPATAVRPVSPSPFRYVGGPRTVQPANGQPGGGVEYRIGGFK